MDRTSYLGPVVQFQDQFNCPDQQQSARNRRSVVRATAEAGTTWVRVSRSRLRTRRVPGRVLSPGHNARDRMLPPPARSQRASPSIPSRSATCCRAKARRSATRSMPQSDSTSNTWLDGLSTMTGSAARAAGGRPRSGRVPPDEQPVVPRRECRRCLCGSPQTQAWPSRP